MSSSFRLLIILVAILIVFHPMKSAAQQLTLSGTVRDVDGVVPEAAVTLIGRGMPPRTTRTDNTGHYTFNSLASGYYEMSFAKAGYDVMTRTLTLGPNTGPVDVVFACYLHDGRGNAINGASGLQPR